MPFWPNAPVMTHPGLPLAIALIAAPFVAVLQSKAMAPLALIPMAITLGLGWRAGWRPGLPQGPVLLLGLMLAGSAGITALWAPEPGRAALLAVTLAAMMLLAHGAAGAAQGARLMPWLGFGLVLGLAAAFADWQSGNALRAAVRGLKEVPASLVFGLKPAASLMALLLPMAFALPWPWVARGALLVLGAGVLIALPGETARLATIAGLGAAAFSLAAPRLGPRLVGAVVALAILAMPLLVVLVPQIPSASLPPSAVHRLVIWDFAAQRIAEKPITGWGLEASRAMPGGRAQPDAATLDRLNIRAPALRDFVTQPHAELMPLHPHNGALQLWLELGVIGALIGAALMLALGVAASRSAAPAAGAGMLASAAVTGMLSFGLWQAWWVASLLLAMVALALVPRRV
ncbi:MAG: O-antigen ligase family protein [Roseomonas sp.]|nr:O-antigen ligase family protein [Roseomonas sp.]